MASKYRAFVEKAGDQTLLEFNMRGHKVKRMTTDNEVSRGVRKPYLGKVGVAVAPTRAGFHEKR